MYRVMLYDNSIRGSVWDQCNVPVMIILYKWYRPCILPKVNLYITVLGGDFWKYLNGEFFFHLTIEIHSSFIVCRITLLQEDVLLQSFTEQYFIVNKRFWDNWVRFKILNIPIHLHSESILHIWCLFCINRP